MSRDIEPFAQLVRDYIAVIDRAGESTPHSLLSSCAWLLPRIYAAGIELPDVQPTNDNVDDEPAVPSPMARLASILGRYDGYFEVFDPFVQEEPVKASLADDLADIYLDLARPLTAFDAGEIADAAWDWRFAIRGHCGDHLVDAMRAIHRLVNNHMSPDYSRDADRAV